MMYLRQLRLPKWCSAFGVSLFVVVLCGAQAAAITPLPTPPPSPGSYGLEATKTQAPPKQGATISVPANGASFTTSPTTVSGICVDGLLVQVLDNNVMVGSVMCKNGSFSLQVSLFSGKNDLSALVFDDTNQEGPVSNTVTVTYNNTHFTSFGQQVTLTSQYGRRAASVGTPLDWPLQLSGGTGPYAFSIDWGDGSASQLQSQALAGGLTIEHVYKSAGVYEVNIRAVDSKGVTAFLQVVAIANGSPSAASGTSGSSSSSSKTQPQTKVLWVPSAISMVLLIPAFLLGQMSKLTSLRHKMDKERDAYEKE